MPPVDNDLDNDDVRNYVLEAEMALEAQVAHGCRVAHTWYTRICSG